MQILKKNSKGSLVSYLQLSLKNANIDVGKVDGIFGNLTHNAVIKFQSSHDLKVDGIVGNNTWQALFKYMTVPTTINYTYDILNLNILALLYNFPFITTGIIGTSTMGKKIPYVKLGDGPKKLLYVAGTHANEWICCPLLMKFIESYCTSYSNDEKIQNKSAKDISSKATIYIIPMLNPDGIDLVLGNIDKKSSNYINAEKIAQNYPNIRFPDGWKANISGVDLNLQFPAKWEEAKRIKYSQGYTTYAPRDFVGKKPLQAKEAIALYDFCNENSFDLMLTYHTQGNVIYYKFLDFNPPNSQKIGETFSNISGYTLEVTPYSSSFAGFKDWFIQNYNLPGYTFEVGIGTNPLPLSQFDSIYEKNIGVLEIAPFLI